jgi:hypothetical protein
MDLEGKIPKHPDGDLCHWRYNQRKLNWGSDCGALVDYDLFSKMVKATKTRFDFCPVCGKRITTIIKEYKQDDQAPDKIWLTLDYEYRGEKYYDWTSSPNELTDVPYIKTEIVAEALEAINEDVGSDNLAPLSRGCEILKRAMEIDK